MISVSWQAKPHAKGWGICASGLLVLAAACAEQVPPNRYGITSVEIEGAERMDDASLKVCLATHERESFGFTFGKNPDPECGQPPFDAGRTHVQLWTWPWSEWPVYDQAVLDRDVERIERWYRARGFYDASVVAVRVDRDREEQRARVTLVVDEGEPVLVSEIVVRGLEGMPEDIQQRALAALQLQQGERFDEAYYDRGNEALAKVLREASYAAVQVQGSVEVDAERKRARVELHVIPGRVCRFGTVTVEGNEDLPTRPIIGAADIERDEMYSDSALRDARNAVFGLGPFASVEMIPHVNEVTGVVDVTIRVSPARRFRFGVGAGILAGNIDPGDTENSLDRWDVHLLARAEHRNFLGGMRRFSIEDRPRLIFPSKFPELSNPNTTQGIEPGNLLILRFRQPAFLEARTQLLAAAQWDLGPDPFGEDFSRHDISVWVGPERFFFDGTLRVSSTIHFNFFCPTDGIFACREDDARTYEVTFMQHDVRLDLRDDPRRPSRGSLFGVNFQHAGYFLRPSTWDYVRLRPEARGYVPLPLGIVLAGRARLGIMDITGHDIALPGSPGEEQYEQAMDLRQLGPIQHRFRGGGQNSVRGYRPNTVGDAEEVCVYTPTDATGDRLLDASGEPLPEVRLDDCAATPDPEHTRNKLITGGLYQWEASLELRVPITENFGTVAFMDMGDVARGIGPAENFRFDHPHTSFGVGLRYHTIVGPLRFDLGFAPPSLQVFGADQRPQNRPAPSSFLGLGPAAAHLTIGEAF